MKTYLVRYTESVVKQAIVTAKSKEEIRKHVSDTKSMLVSATVISVEDRTITRISEIPNISGIKNS